MRYIVIPITDAKFIFSEDELAHMRKSVDETQVIVHEGIMLDKRKAMGMNVLPSETSGQIEWTYPVYEYNTDELNNLLNSSAWNSEEEQAQLSMANSLAYTQRDNTSTSTTKTRKTRSTTSKKATATTNNTGKNYWNF